MNKDELFNQYQRCVADLVSLTLAVDNSQSDIAREERNSVVQIENEYLKVSMELNDVKLAIEKQYRNIWEICSANFGLRRPEDQRPACTDKSWRECVREQELAAKAIQDCLNIKTQQAIADKQRQLQKEAEKRMANDLFEAEAERKRREEVVALEEARGASLLEEMKRKFKR